MVQKRHSTHEQHKGNDGLLVSRPGDCIVILMTTPSVSAAYCNIRFTIQYGAMFGTNKETTLSYVYCVKLDFITTLYDITKNPFFESHVCVPPFRPHLRLIAF